MQKNKLSTTTLTKMTIGVAKLVCRVWAFGRSFSRDKSDFDYFIHDLRKQYPNEVMYQTVMKDIPFFKKTVQEDTSVAKTSSIKIGDCNIKYTVTRLKRMGREDLDKIEIQPLNLVHNEYIHRYMDLNSIENLVTQTKIHHNNPNVVKVVDFKRKDSDVVKMHDK